MFHNDLFQIPFFFAKINDLNQAIKFCKLHNFADDTTYYIFKLYFKKTLWPLLMDGVQLPQGQSQFEEIVYFLPLGSQKFLVLTLSSSEGQKTESTLEPPSDLNIGPLDQEFSTFTTRPLLHKSIKKMLHKCIKNLQSYKTIKIYP